MGGLDSTTPGLNDKGRMPVTRTFDVANLPSPALTYRSNFIDSRRWDAISPRGDDIVIAAPPKSGTTWMQMIVALLIFQTPKLPDTLENLSPWVELATDEPLDVVADRLARQTHRRFLKTHMAPDCFPVRASTFYLVVGRDARDAGMSLWNIYARRKPTPLIEDRRIGDCGTFFRTWLSRGVVPWESDGYPYVSGLRFIREWWPFRQCRNVLFIHFNEMLGDLDGVMRRVAWFLKIEVDEHRWPDLVRAASFAEMKKNAHDLVPMVGAKLDGGAEAFIFKGTIGRWRSALSKDDLAYCQKVVARALSPDAARWLETGDMASSLPGQKGEGAAIRSGGVLGLAPQSTAP